METQWWLEWIQRRLKRFLGWFLGLFVKTEKSRGACGGAGTQGQLCGKEITPNYNPVGRTEFKSLEKLKDWFIFGSV